MGQILQSPSARNDIIEIWLYIAQDDPDAADRLVATIDAKLDLLSDSPNMGKAREELAPSLRSFPCGNYLLFYRPIAQGIELVRVAHGARDIEALFE